MILSAVIVGGFALAFIYFVITTNQNKQLNKILIDKEGTIYKGVDFLSDQEFYNINARAHLILFVKFLYQFSKENINYNMNHARFLGDNTIDIIYQNNNQNNVYSQIINIGAATYIDEQELKNNLHLENKNFNAHFTMFVITAKEKIPLQIDITGTLHQVAKTDNNPHGLSISNLKQKITK